MATRYNIRPLTVLIVIILLAFGLRVFDLRDRALGGDEVVTLYRELNLIDRYVTENPPDYKPRHYLWTMLTLPFVWVIPNEVGVRWLSVIAGVMAVPVMYRVMAIIAGRRAAMLAALFTALSPVMLFLSQEARQYTFVMLLNLVMLWQVLRVHYGSRGGNESRKGRMPSAPTSSWMVITGMLIVGLHATSIIWVLIVITWLVIAERGRRIGLWVATVIGAGVVAGAIFVAEQFIGNELVPPVSMPTLASVFEYFRMGFGRSPYMGEPPQNVVLKVGFYAMLAVAAIYVRRVVSRPREVFGRNRGVGLVLALLFVSPVIFVIISYSYESFWLWRYLAPYMMSALMLAAMAIVSIPFRALQTVMAGLTVTSMLLLSVLYGHIPEYQHVNWRKGYEYLEAHRGDEAALIGGTARLWEHFGGAPEGMIMLDEDVLTFEADVASITERLDLKSGDGVWIVWSDRNRSDLREWVIEKYGGTRLEYQEFGGTYVERYEIP